MRFMGAVFNFIHHALDEIYAYAAFFTLGNALLHVRLSIGLQVEGVSAILNGNPEMVFIPAYRNINTPGSVELIGMFNHVGDGLIYGQTNFFYISFTKAMTAGMRRHKVAGFCQMFGRSGYLQKMC